MRNLLLTTLLLAFSAGEAAAGAWEAKTGREPLATREVERPLVLQKNWLEFGLGTDWKNAVGYWDADGQPVDFEHARWTYSTQRLHIRYGITRRSELFWLIPFHYLRLTNEHLGTDTSTFGMGDPEMAYRFEVYRGEPLTSVVLEARLKVPAGLESGGSYLGGPYAVGGFVLSTGTPDYTLALRAKKLLGPVALEGYAGYTYRMSSTVQYLIEVTDYQFGGRIKPGNVVFGGLEVMAQLGPVAPVVGAHLNQRGLTHIGTTGRTIFSLENMYPVQESDGMALDATAGVVFNITRGVDVVAGAMVPIMGEDLLFFPLESMTPTRGVTYSGTLELRY